MLNNEIGLDINNILNEITRKTEAAVEKGTQVDKLLISTAGITEAQGFKENYKDAVPIILFQDYYNRVLDKCLASGRNESSNMMLPIIAWSMHGSQSTVKMFEMAFGNKPIESLSICRNNEANQASALNYLCTYSQVLVCAASEILIQTEWYVIFVGITQEITKTYVPVNNKQELQGNVPVKKNFLTGSIA